MIAVLGNSMIVGKQVSSYTSETSLSNKELLQLYSCRLKDKSYFFFVFFMFFNQILDLIRIALDNFF